MKIVILDALTLGDDLDLSAIAAIGNLMIYPTTSKEEVVKRISDADIVITNKVVIGREQMETTSLLKLICVAATGMNNIDLEAAKDLNISVRNVSGYSTEGVAQHAMACILYGSQHMSYYNTYSRTEYVSSPVFTNHGRTIYELKGKTIGILGMGAIGQRVAQLATAFGLNIQYHSASGKNLDQPYKHVDRNTFFTTSDIISIHAPLNSATKNFVNAESISRMKSSASLVNTGRGGIVDEEALASALNSDKLSFAALDVFEQEPIRKDHSLLKVSPEKILLTPHIAWASLESRKKLIDGIELNIRVEMSEGR